MSGPKARANAVALPFGFGALDVGDGDRNDEGQQVQHRRLPVGEQPREDVLQVLRQPLGPGRALGLKLRPGGTGHHVLGGGSQFGLAVGRADGEDVLRAAIVEVVAPENLLRQMRGNRS